MVATSSPSGRYAVTVCVYIMFCAVTRPVGDATTDLGEIEPVIRSRRTSSVVADGGPDRGVAGAVRVAGGDVAGPLVVARVGVADGEAVGVLAAAADVPGSSSEHEASTAPVTSSTTAAATVPATRRRRTAAWSVGRAGMVRWPIRSG